jgi:hypothetical protein
MTIKLVGTSGPSAAFAELTELVNKIKADTDGALLMLEGRIHAIESVNAVAHELPEKPAKKAKSS